MSGYCSSMEQHQSNLKLQEEAVQIKAELELYRSMYNGKINKYVLYTTYIGQMIIDTQVDHTQTRRKCHYITNVVGMKQSARLSRFILRA